LIDENIKNQIIANTDIVALVGEYVKLEKAGREYAGLCPFHAEKTPSFKVSPEKKICKCMGCGVGGNAITFLQKIENISYEKACQKLALPLGIDLKIKTVPKYQPQEQNLITINNLARDFYKHSLFSTQSGLEALSYLKERGLDEEIIKKFQIGLAPFETDLLYKTLKDQNVSEITMLELGLIHSGEHGYFDAFTKRIIFPVIDEEGNTIGFSGRIYNSDHIAKYINSMEGPLFKKGSLLYNLNNALAAIRKNNRVILYEGFLDVIASDKADLKEAVCSMGTALTEIQAKLIKKYAPEVIVCFDGDNAGIKATLKAISVLEAVGLIVSVVSMPKATDPDDYVQKYGVQAFSDYFDTNRQKSHEFFYDYYKSVTNLKSMAEAEVFKDTIFRLIRNLSNTLREKYFHRLSKDLDLQLITVERDFIEVYGMQRTKKTEAKKNANQAPSGELWAERILISHMLNDRKQAKYIEEKLGNIAFDEAAFEIRSAIDDYYKRYDRMDIQILSMDFSVNSEEYYRKNLMNYIGEYQETERDDCLEKINLYIRKRQRRKILDELASIEDYQEKLSFIQEKGEYL